LFFPYIDGVVEAGGLIADPSSNIDILGTSPSGDGYAILQGDPLTVAITVLKAVSTFSIPLADLSSYYKPSSGTFGLDGSGHFCVGIYVENEEGLPHQNFLGVGNPQPGKVDCRRPGNDF
jgi:hypothetical protein